MKRDQVRQSRRAFSLIELLIVILIIALLVAILLPALGSVRGRSREAATRNLMSNLSSSISMFETDQKKLPGYFTAKEMGANANQTEGFSGMNNILLDLAGGVVTTGGTGDVGPMPNSGVKYDDNAVGKAGANSKAYFTPPAANWKALNGTTELGTKNASAGNMFVKELVDAEGMPILAWVQDPMAIGPIDGISDIARQSSNGQEPSRFYQSSNWVFLDTLALGKKGIDQRNKSMIGGTGAGPNGVIALGAMLSAPGSPIDTNLSVNNILPSAPRGSFVLQSAGRNSVYLGREERGATLTGPSGVLFYGLNFKDATGNPIRDTNGGASSSDILKDFDDIVVAGS